MVGFLQGPRQRVRRHLPLCNGLCLSTYHLLYAVPDALATRDVSTGSATAQVIINIWIKISVYNHIYLLCRILGFVPLFVSTCKGLVTVQINCTDFGTMNFTQDIRILNFSEHAAVDEIMNPFAIIFCVYVMALVSSLLMGPQVSYSK